MKIKELFKNKVFLVIAVVVLIIFFWRCPFYEGIGIPCPGCFMRRALFSVLRFDFRNAFLLNPSIFAAIPLFFISLYSFLNKKIKFLIATGVVFGVILLIVYLFRVIFFFNEGFFVYNDASLLGFILKIFNLNFF